MRITLKCGCKCSLNKRKKTFTVEKLCGKHLKELMDRIHDQMWYGQYWKDIVKKYSAYMDEQGTIQVSPNTLFWLRWLERTRNTLKIGQNSSYGVVATK